MKVKLYTPGDRSEFAPMSEYVRKITVELANGMEFTISEDKFGGLCINKHDGAISIQPHVSNEITIK